MAGDRVNASERLQRELGKRCPFEVPEQEVYLHLTRTAARLGNMTLRLFRAHGLTESSYNTLRILRGHGEAGCRIKEITAQLVVPVPDASRVVDRLVARGLVSRRIDPSDRRSVFVVLTTAGRALVDGLDEPIVELHRLQLGHLSREELARLGELLAAVRAPHEPGGEGGPAG